MIQQGVICTITNNIYIGAHCKHHLSTISPKQSTALLETPSHHHTHLEKTHAAHPYLQIVAVYLPLVLWRSSSTIQLPPASVLCAWKWRRSDRRGMLTAASLVRAAYFSRMCICVYAALSPRTAFTIRLLHQWAWNCVSKILSWPNVNAQRNGNWIHWMSWNWPIRGQAT